MFDVEENTTTDDEIRDALGEVANMTAGNVKALVESYCRLSLPMVAEGRELAISIPGSRVVAQASFDCDDAPLTIEVYEKAADPRDPCPVGAEGAPPAKRAAPLLRPVGRRLRRRPTPIRTLRLRRVDPDPRPHRRGDDE